MTTTSPTVRTVDTNTAMSITSPDLADIVQPGDWIHVDGASNVAEYLIIAGIEDGTLAANSAYNTTVTVDLEKAERLYDQGRLEVLIGNPDDLWILDVEVESNPVVTWDGHPEFNNPSTVRLYGILDGEAIFKRQTDPDADVDMFVADGREIQEAYEAGDFKVHSSDTEE
ncbi:hypothetical protein RYH80_17950 [Halobaculum sp. MBLA0147]|uniref:hypothetical protein n=1 Tax=Halobaculum sp. MBLA0147 TaxID=3079934 RepID=UPI0035269991